MIDSMNKYVKGNNFITIPSLWNHQFIQSMGIRGWMKVYLNNYFVLHEQVKKRITSGQGVFTFKVNIDWSYVVYEL